MTRLTFDLDFISPYAYLAWTQIHALAERCGATVVPHPVLFAGLLNHHGQKGPAEIEAKRRWVGREIVRRAAMLGVPFGAPSTHPFNPLLALRAVIAAPEEGRRALVDGLYAAVWGAGPKPAGVDDPAIVGAVAEAAGLDPAALLARAGSPEVKAQLRDNTEAAIEAGVFGVPTMRVGEELFFGLDSFDLLERFLTGEDPLDEVALAAWLAVRPSAQRRT